jgi:hypothetical protein
MIYTSVNLFIMKSIFFFRSPLDQEGSTSTTETKKTDSTKLKTTKNDSVYVSPDAGTTNEPFPVPGIEYDFCIDIFNTGDLPSDSFYVRFSLDDGNGNVQDFDFNQDAGLDAGHSVKAVVHFGQFSDDDLDYTLSACIYSASSPDMPIDCAGTFGFNPHINH